MTGSPPSPEPTPERARRRLERERKARLEAEAIAERVTRELYATVQELEGAKGELERANVVLESANQSLQEFVAVASHDMRAPLTSILGYAEMMLAKWERIDDPRKMEFVGVIDQQGRRLRRLVDDLLTVSKIDMGAVEAHLEKLCVRIELERTLVDLGEARGLVDVVAPQDLQVLADPDHLHRILENYIGNALKYGAPPIAAEAGEAGEWVEFRVRDRGDGVPDEFVHRLFGKFARAESATTRAKAGTGLGLSIVRGLARANGGEAWYEPNTPTGSCFGLRLPKPA